MNWTFNPIAWINGSGGTVVAASDYQHIAADIQTQGGNASQAGYGRTNAGFLGLQGGALPGVSYAITAATWTSGTVTLTVGAHVIQAGQVVGVSGITPAGYNISGASVQVTAIGATTIQFSLASNPGAYTSGGTVLVSGAAPFVNQLAADNANHLNMWNGTAWVVLAGGLMLDGSSNLTLPSNLTVTGSTGLTGSLTLAGGSAFGMSGVFTNPAQPGVSASDASGVSIPSGAWTPVALNTQGSYNVGGMHSTTTNNTRLNILSAGTYLCGGQLQFVSGSGGSFRAARMQKTTLGVTGSYGGTQIPCSTVSSDVCVVVTPALFTCVVGDYVEIAGNQDTGSSYQLRYTGSWAFAYKVS